MSVLAELEKLSSAEEFFSCLKVDYDPALLHVARLHILKRMGKYLAAKDFSGASEEQSSRKPARRWRKPIATSRRRAPSMSASSRFCRTAIRPAPRPRRSPRQRLSCPSTS